MENKEIWKAVVGYHGIYEVSNIGRVRSLPRTVTHGDRTRYQHGKILKKIRNSTKGYWKVILCNENVRKTKLIHDLVYEAFRNEKPIRVHHINGNIFDNRIENLINYSLTESMRRIRLRSLES